MSFQATQRYAQALFEVCKDTDDLNRVHEDLVMIESSVISSSEFQEFLRNPVVPKEKQLDVINELFNKKISDSTLKYLHFLIQKDRLNLLKGICATFDRFYLEEKNIVKIDVFTNIALKEVQLSSLKKQLGDKLNKDIQTNVVINPAMIGGVKVRIGDEIFDYTIQTQLEEFRANYMKAF